MPRWILLVGLLLLPACNRTPFKFASSKPAPPKPPACDFQVVGTPPNPAEYEEIGVINGADKDKDTEEYKRKIAPLVCRAGGDLVVGQINGFGIYVRGIVFRKVPAAKSG